MMFRQSLLIVALSSLVLSSTAFAPSRSVGRTVASRSESTYAPSPLFDAADEPSKDPTDLTGKVAFIAGVGDSSGYGWAIAKALADKGATIIVGTWPPILKIFQMGLKRGSFDDDSITASGGKMEIEKVYPLDAVFDTPEDIPDEIKENKRYKGLDGYTISEVAKAVEADYGKIDILVHSLANGPEVTKPLLETSRKGYLAASSASAYSFVSLVQHFGPIMNEGSSALSLTYIASEKVIPGYGGGMSSAKAQLESDTRTLAFEAGRKFQMRVNTISAGPLKSRAATAIGKEAGKKSFIEYAHMNYSISSLRLFTASLVLYLSLLFTPAQCKLINLLTLIGPNNCSETPPPAPTSSSKTLFPTPLTTEGVTCPGWDTTCNCASDCNGDDVLEAADFCRCQEAMDCCNFYIPVYEPPDDGRDEEDMPDGAIMCPNQPTWCDCGYDCVDEWDWCDCDAGHECCGYTPPSKNDLPVIADE